jgi:hypothetical protein
MLKVIVLRPIPVVKSKMEAKATNESVDFLFGLTVVDREIGLRTRII